MTRPLLEFELGEHNTLCIHGDEAGLRYFIGEIEKVIASTQAGHYHHENIPLLGLAGRETPIRNDDTATRNAIETLRVYCWKGDTGQPRVD